MKKTFKRLLWVVAILLSTLLAILWLIARNNKEDGVGVAVGVMGLLFLLSTEGDGVKSLVKAVVGLLVIVSWWGANARHFYGGFAEGSILCVVMYFLWPITRDSFDKYLKAKKARTLNTSN